MPPTTSDQQLQSSPSILFHQTNNNNNNSNHNDNTESLLFSSSSGATSSSGGNFNSVNPDNKSKLNKLIRFTPRGLPEFFKNHPWARKIDLFYYQPVPQHVCKEYSSFRGIIASIALIIGILVYLGMAWSSFAEGTATLVQRQVPSGDEETEVVPFALVFRVNDVYGTPTIPFINDSYYRAVARSVTVFDQDSKPRTFEEIKMVPCDVSGWGTWLGKTALCPEKTIKMYGRYQNPSYKFGEFFVLRCDDNNPYTYLENDTIVKCAPPDEIARKFTYGRWTMLQLFGANDANPAINGGQPQYEATQLFNNNPDNAVWYEGRYALRKTTVHPDYFFTWQTKHYQRVEFVRDRTHTVRAFPARSNFNNTWVGGWILLSAGFSIDSFSTEEEIRPISSADAMGSSYAFGSLIFSLLAIYFHWYNEEKFYAAHPMWTGFDNNFNRTATTANDHDDDDDVMKDHVVTTDDNDDDSNQVANADDNDTEEEMTNKTNENNCKKKNKNNNSVIHHKQI